MQGMFLDVGIKLVDFKLEFGRASIDGKKEIILADEPSANLDQDSARNLLELLKNIHSKGTLVLMATHQWQHLYFELIKDREHRIINIERGRLVD